MNREEIYLRAKNLSDGISTAVSRLQQEKGYTLEQGLDIDLIMMDEISKKIFSPEEYEVFKTLTDAEIIEYNNNIKRGR